MKPGRPNCAIAAVMLTLSVQAFAALPGGWFASYVAERTAPAVLTGPVEEKWRTDADAVLVHGARVFLATRASPPTDTQPASSLNMQQNPQGTDLPNYLQAREEALLRGMECRDIHTGRVLWRVECDREAGERPWRPVWIENLILVAISHGRGGFPAAQPATQSEVKRFIWMLDANTGEVIRRLGPRQRDLWSDRLAAMSEAHRKPGGPFLMNRDRIGQTYLKPGGPGSPVSSDPTTWSYDDAALLMEVLRENAIPRCGAVSGFSALLNPTGDLFWIDPIRFRLCKGTFASEDTVWETPFISGASGMAWLSSMIVPFSSTSAIAAYNAQTGRPLWTHEWPSDLENYTRQLAALADGILLLTDPQVPRPNTVRKFRGVYNSTERNSRSFLTKLDVHGKVVFRQELPVLLAYGRMAVGNNAVLVWNGVAAPGEADERCGEGPVICLGPSDPVHPGKSESKADIATIQQLISSYDSAETRERVVICTDLARLGDTRIVDRVLSDLKTANSADRVFYVQALAILGDGRIVPELISLLEENTLIAGQRPSPQEEISRRGNLMLFQEIQNAIVSLTDGDPLTNDAYRQWRDRQIPALREAYERAKFASERVGISAQLRQLRDPKLFGLLMQSLESAPPNEQGLYLGELGMLKDKRAIPTLLKFMKGDVMIRHTAHDALRWTTGTGMNCYTPETWQEWWDAHRHLYEVSRGPAGG